jgi:NagD protein
MDTDIIAGIESGLDPILVLTGVTTHESMEQYPYQPRLMLSGVGDIVPKQNAI